MKKHPEVPLPPKTKIQVAAEVVTTYALVHAELKRYPLPELVDRLTAGSSRPRQDLEPLRLAKIVHKVLRVGERRPRCLVGALVLYRLLTNRGMDPDLVIGLPTDAGDKDAHAWIELYGADVGPPPGKGDNVELARYPRR